MAIDFNQERVLENQYQGVLGYAEAQDFLKQSPYTAGQIRGAIQRFCNSTETDRPGTFTEMEVFVSDFIDWWLDLEPEKHTIGEFTLRQCVSNYLAFTSVWKKKSQTSNILNPEIMKAVGMSLMLKNSLGTATKAAFSYAKRNPALSAENLCNGFLMAHNTLLPFLAGKWEITNANVSEDIARLIGGYLAGDQLVLAASDKLKMIESKAA